jgi:very-short-patch-repair endonuclease
VNDGRVVIGQRIPEGLADRAKEFRRVMTPAEAVLWQELRGRRLAGWKFRRQQIVDGFVVDFYCHAAALVVEVDGGVHSQQTESDQARDETLASRGIFVLRVTNNDVLTNLELVVRRILDTLNNHT